jgi:thymidylate kinase
VSEMTIAVGRTRGVRGFSVALVGGDGVGKTTIAKRMVADGGARYRYLYMGQSVLSSNLALPTSRLARALKRRMSSGSRETSPVSGRGDATVDPHRLPARRGRIRIAASFLNRLAEARWRQLVVFLYRRRGHVVLLDRHILFESLSEGPARRRSGWLERYEYRLLDRSYPRPDVVVFLDAPIDVLRRRKGEVRPSELERLRGAILELGGRMPAFHRVDADRPLEDVLADVNEIVTAFAGAGPKAERAG